MKRLLLLLFLQSAYALSQCNTANFPALELGNDTTICQGQQVIYNFGATYNTYLWENNSSQPFRTITNSGSYTLDVTGTGGNLVLNPGFENGAVNFTTDYVPGTGGAWGLLSNTGQYDISTSPSLSHNNFSFCSDHGPGTGNMMVVNGASTPNTEVWCQTVNVTPNTDYLFAAWVTNALNTTNVADLQLFINGTAIGPIFSTGTIGCNWQQFNNAWNSGTATTAELCIMNQNTLNAGNDFALDDISFGPICTASDTINITVDNPVQTISTADPTCLGLANGEIEIVNPTATAFSIDGGANWQSNAIFTGLTDGTYQVCSKTVNDCETCDFIVLNPGTAVFLSISNDTTICQNGTATLTANAVGGNSFEYTWDMTADLGNIQNVNPSSNESYTVFATNENGCNSVTETINVTVRDDLSADISTTLALCEYESGTFTLSTVSGGLAPYSFQWVGPTGVLGTSISQTVTGSSPGNYAVTVIDVCESTPLILSANLIQNPTPIPSFNVQENNLCEPATFDLTNTSSNSASITWEIETLATLFNTDTINVGEFMAGNYGIELTVTSAEGCISSSFFQNALNVIPIPNADFSWTPSPILMFNTTANFINQSDDATTYLWNITQGEPAVSALENPTTLFPDGIAGDYSVELIAYSEFGCADTITKIVTVYPEVILYAPNTFTPDGDEFNQNWRVFIEGIDIYDFELTLYNRWGEIIWVNHNPEKAWDGTYNGKVVEDGTYVWTIRAKDVLNDNVRNFKGTVTVLR
ncbi:MAG: gliding motility-associated C-terminal domain-containing protein [Lishizhenia sp.]